MESRWKDLNSRLKAFAPQAPVEEGPVVVAPTDERRSRLAVAAALGKIISDYPVSYNKTQKVSEFMDYLAKERMKYGAPQEREIQKR